MKRRTKKTFQKIIKIKGVGGQNQSKKKKEKKKKKERERKKRRRKTGLKWNRKKDGNFVKNRG